MAKKKEPAAICPFCGGNVRVELKTADNYRNPDAEVKYIAKCSRCEARAIEADTEEDAMNNFLFDRFTEETVLLSRPLTPDTIDDEGALKLLERHFALMGDEYKRDIIELTKLKKKGAECDEIDRGNLKMLECETQMLEEGLTPNFAAGIRRFAVQEATAEGNVVVSVYAKEGYRPVVYIRFENDSWKPYVNSAGKIRMGIGAKTKRMTIYKSNGNGELMRLLDSHGAKVARTSKEAAVKWAYDHLGRRRIIEDYGRGIYID